MNALRRLLFIGSATGLTSLALFTSGCPSVPGECRITADCAAGEVCRANECMPAEDNTADAGPGVDAGTPPDEDGGPEPADAGPVQEDAGPVEVDAGPVEDDAGPVLDDAGATSDDAGDDDDAGDGDAG